MARERSPEFLTAVGIGVSDLARSRAFYEGVLGMKYVREFKLPNMNEVVLDHEGRSAVLRMHYTDGVARNFRDNWVKLVFYVADPAALAAKVRAAGCEVTHQPTANANMQGSMLCMAKDPDGYTIELIQRPARVSQTQEAVG